MKTIKYKVLGHTVETDQDGNKTAVEALAEVSMPYSEENLALAREQAHGEVTVEDDGTGMTGETVTEAMSKACQSAITAGVDVTLSDGTVHHYSLTQEDQLNLMSLQSMAAAGAEAVPYHADGEACVYYSAVDFNKIIEAATLWKLYQESYFNSLRGYIHSLADEKELAAVAYGMEIPEAFQTDVLRQLKAQMTGGNRT